MAEFQKKQTWQKVLYSKGSFIVILFLIGFMIYNIFSILPKLRETALNKNKALNQVESIQEQTATLTSRIEKLKTEQGIEDDIRSKFRVVKEGEGLIVIVDDPKKEEVKQEESGGFWSFLKKLFK